MKFLVKCNIIILINLIKKLKNIIYFYLKGFKKGGRILNNYSYLPIFTSNQSEAKFKLSSVLKTKELNLLNYLFKYYEKTKIKEVKVEKKVVIQKSKLGISDNLEKFISGIVGKRIICNFSNDTVSFFNIFEHVFIDEKHLVFYFSNEILMSFEAENFFSFHKLKDVIRLKSKNTMIFYNEILVKLQRSKKFRIDLNEFKKLFAIDDESYTRFYDLERYLLKPVLKDIELLGDYPVKYNRIKTGDSRTNKIIGLEFELDKFSDEENTRSIDHLIEYIKEDIQNFNKIYKMIFDFIQIYGYEYAYENIVFSKQNPNKNFEDFLIDALKNNYAALDYDKIYGLEKMIYSLEKMLTIGDFQNLVQYTLIDIDYYYSYNIKFLKKVKKIKENGWIYFSDEKYLVLGAFFISKKSFLRVYKI